jgi:hypothetical protein
MAYLKLLIVGTLAISAFTQVITRETWWFIQNVNLIFHEAGHVLFIFFGDTLYLLGGTIFEIGIPFLVTLYFYRRQQYFSAACTSWWLTTALLSVSVYASDARERLLPLITNDITTHDWFNLLSQYNLLRYDDVIGNGFGLAAIAATTAIILLSLRDRDVRKFLSEATSEQRD